ncbi:MAG: hypothetical protein WC855_15060 [Thermodesulfovibrionales bacterium]
MSGIGAISFPKTGLISSLGRFARKIAVAAKIALVPATGVIPTTLSLAPLALSSIGIAGCELVPELPLICGNNIAADSTLYPYLISNSPMFRKIEAILDFPSMRNVRRLINSIDGNNDILLRLSFLLENYDPCQPIDQLEARFGQAYNGLNMQPYCIPESEFYNKTRITPEFLKNLTHAMYVEVNGLVPWSLSQYSLEEMEYLLPTRPCESLNNYPPNFVEHQRGFQGGPACGENIENREAYKVFPLVRNGILSDQRLTAAKVIELVPLHFFHSYMEPEIGENWPGFHGSYKFEDYEDTELLSDYLPLGPLFRERVLPMGCHTAASIAATLLRALNIPAFEADGHNFGSLYLDGHGILLLPSLGLYSHGDWLADMAGRSGMSLLYDWNSFPIVGRNSQLPIGGSNNAVFGVFLHRNKDGLLYINGPFNTYPAGCSGCFPVQGFDGDINHPLPQIVDMMENLRSVYPSARFEPDPDVIGRINVVIDPEKPEPLNSLRRRACGGN